MLPLLPEKVAEIESFNPASFVFSIAALWMGAVSGVLSSISTGKVTVDDLQIFGGRLIGLPEPSRSLH